MQQISCDDAELRCATGRLGVLRKPKVVLSAAIILVGYVLTFCCCARVLRIDSIAVSSNMAPSAQSRQPILLYMSRDPMWNRIGRYVFYPIIKPLEMAGLACYSDEVGAIPIGYERLIEHLWYRMVAE